MIGRIMIEIEIIGLRKKIQITIREKKDHEHDIYIPLHDRAKGKEVTPINPEKYKNENMLARILMGVEGSDKMLGEIKSDLLLLNQMVTPPSASIKKNKIQLSQISSNLNA